MRQHRGVERRRIPPALRQRRPMRVRVERGDRVPVPGNRVHRSQPQHIQRRVRAGHERRQVRHHRGRRRRSHRRPRSRIRAGRIADSRTTTLQDPPLRIRRRKQRRHREPVSPRGPRGRPERARRRHGHEGSLRPGITERPPRDASRRPGTTIRPAPIAARNRRRRRGPQRPRRMQRPGVRPERTLAVRVRVRRSVRQGVRREAPARNSAGFTSAGSIAQRTRARGRDPCGGQVQPG